MLNFQLPRAVGAWFDRLTRHDDASPGGAADTVAQWPPTAARVLASAERHAHKCLVQALALEHPKGYLLAHVPLHKLVKVPRNSTYREWLSRTGLLTVDFALCDEHGYVRSVVLMPLRDDQSRQTHKRQRLLRVLGATGLPILEWDREWQNDEVDRLRGTLFPTSHAAVHYADTPHAEH